MRLRLLLRRLTISAPHMSVRSSMPWPVRWAVAAIVLGFCAAISLWAFEFGKDIAGLDHGTKQELIKLRAEMDGMHAELEKAQEERDKAQSIADTVGTLVTAGKASEYKLIEQVKQLQAENQGLRNDLGFFEKLIPSGGVEGVVRVAWCVFRLHATRNTQHCPRRVRRFARCDRLRTQDAIQPGAAA